MQEYICRFQEECALFHRHRYLYCEMTCKTLAEYQKPQQELF